MNTVIAGQTQASGVLHTFLAKFEKSTYKVLWKKVIGTTLTTYMDLYICESVNRMIVYHNDQSVMLFRIINYLDGSVIQIINEQPHGHPITNHLMTVNRLDGSTYHFYKAYRKPSHVGPGGWDNWWTLHRNTYPNPLNASTVSS